MEDCLKGGGHKIWKFVQQTDYSWQTEIMVGRSFDSEWLSISKDGTIRVKGAEGKEYAWDGCTFKLNLLQITWGVPDGMIHKFGKGDYKPYAYYASMVHDVLYQYKRCAPVTRREADRIFYILLKEAGFLWAPVYYAAVRGLGWIFAGWKYKSFKDIQINGNGTTEESDGAETE